MRPDSSELVEAAGERPLAMIIARDGRTTCPVSTSSATRNSTAAIIDRLAVVGNIVDLGSTSYRLAHARSRGAP